MSRICFTVELNGTDENPYHKCGLTQNPFPQVSKHEYARHLIRGYTKEFVIQGLAGNPIPDTDYIRNHLVGYTKEFVDLCCARFRKGEVVKFDVYFDSGN